MVSTSWLQPFSHHFSLSMASSHQIQSLLVQCHPRCSQEINSVHISPPRCGRCPDAIAIHLHHCDIVGCRGRYFVICRGFNFVLEGAPVHPACQSWTPCDALARPDSRARSRASSFSPLTHQNEKSRHLSLMPVLHAYCRDQGDDDR